MNIVEFVLTTSAVVILLTLGVDIISGIFTDESPVREPKKPRQRKRYNQFVLDFLSVVYHATEVVETYRRQSGSHRRTRN